MEKPLKSYFQIPMSLLEGRGIVLLVCVEMDLFPSVILDGECDQFASFDNFYEIGIAL